MPPELEGVLLAHPEIVDAAVIGVEPKGDREAGELPRAYLVRRDQGSSHPTNDEIMAYMGSRLSSYKQLHGGIVFVDAIPKNASGKILKRELRERAAKELSGNGMSKL